MSLLHLSSVSWMLTTLVYCPFSVVGPLFGMLCQHIFDFLTLFLLLRKYKNVTVLPWHIYNISSTKCLSVSGLHGTIQILLLYCVMITWDYGMLPSTFMCIILVEERRNWAVTLHFLKFLTWVHICLQLQVVLYFIGYLFSCLICDILINS